MKLSPNFMILTFIRIVLRIRYDDEAAQLSLGDKYGSHPNTEAPDLIEMSKSLGLNVRWNVQTKGFNISKYETNNAKMIKLLCLFR